MLYPWGTKALIFLKIHPRKYRHFPWPPQIPFRRGLTVAMKEAILALENPLGPVHTCPSILLNRGCLLEVPDTDLEVGGAVIQTLR